MPAITLPDGSVRPFDAPVTGTDVAVAIGPGLARAALAMKLDGKTVDLATPIERDAAGVPRPESSARSYPGATDRTSKSRRSAP